IGVHVRQRLLMINYVLLLRHATHSTRTRHARAPLGGWDRHRLTPMTDSPLAEITLSMLAVVEEVVTTQQSPFPGDAVAEKQRTDTPAPSRFHQPLNVFLESPARLGPPERRCERWQLAFAATLDCVLDMSVGIHLAVTGILLQPPRRRTDID